MPSRSPQPPATPSPRERYHAPAPVRSAEVLQRAEPLDLGVTGRSADRALAWNTDERKTSPCVADGSGMCWCPRHAAAETVHVDSSNERSNDAGRLDPAAERRRFLDALNRQDLTEAEAWVDPTRYRENCVGFTDGYVNWADAQTSVQTIWKGLPDLHVKLHDLATGPDFAIARGTVSGTALGRLYGAPATKHHYEESYFDYVRLDQGRTVERVQQADLLGQMRQLYGRVLGVAGISAMLLRQHPPDDPTQSA